MQESRKFRLVGGEIEVVLYDIEKQLAEPIFHDIVAEGLRLQKIFNFYDSKSELSELNSKRKLQCSKELIEVIKFALPFCKLTNGEYDITKGKQIKQQKEGQALSKIKCSYKDVVIKGKNVQLTNEDAMLDLGSIAKGYIGDKLVDFAKRLGVKSGFIDMRGDMITFGNHTEEILIQHPRETKKAIGKFNLKNGAVATSGDYKQFIKDYDHSHIIGKKDIISTTVVSKSLMEADVLASVFFLIEIKETEKYFEKNKKVKAVLVDKKLKIYNFNNLLED